MIIIFFKIGPVHADFSGNIIQNWDWSTFKSNETKQERDYYFLLNYFNYNLKLTEYLTFFADLRYFYKKELFSQTNQPDIENRYHEFSPSFYLNLNNPLYFFRIGNSLNIKKFESSLRMKEQEFRENLFFIHYNLTPYEFPSIFFQSNYRTTLLKTYSSEKETTTKDYLITSSYNFFFKKLRGSYYLFHSFSEQLTPDEEIYKTNFKTYTGNLELNYSDIYFKGYVKPFLNYRLNFNKNLSDRYFSVSKAYYIPISGGQSFYANGTLSDPYPWDINTYKSLPALTDTVFNSTEINLRDLYRNIVLKFTLPQSVDKIKLYVIYKGSSFPLYNWKVFKANDPILGIGSWQEIPSFNFNSYLFDPFNNVWAIEFTFFSTQNGQYFKIVNLNNSLNIDVFVAEMEVYEKKVLTGEKKIHQENDFFQEEVNFLLSHDLTPKLTLDEGVYLRRFQSGRFSLFSPIGKVWSSFSETPSRKKIQEEPFVEINRLYYASLRYLIKPNLQTNVRIQKNEVLNNQPNRYETRNYNWSFTYAPLERLNFLLSLIRTENYLYDQMNDEMMKATRDDSLILNINTKIYKEVQWVSDNGVRRSENYISNSTQRGFFTNHLINIPLTRRLIVYANCNFERNILEQDSGERSYSSSKYSFFATYRPGAAINFSYSFSYQKAEETKSILNNLYLNWRITRAILLDTGLGMQKSEPGDVKSWSLYGNLVWYPRKFMDLRLIYNFSSYEQITKTTSQDIGLWLYLRF